MEAEEQRMEESEERRLESESKVLLNAQLMKGSESKRLLYNELIAALKVFFFKYSIFELCESE